MSLSLPIHGRGAAENPANRFERIDVVPDPDGDYVPDESGPRTIYLKDSTRSILAHNDSPDIPHEWSINPYRGCEHGCCYCYARPTHEWIGFSAGLDFESRIMVKSDAAELLRKELSSRKWRPACISLSGVTDCYQPIERKLRITRSCLEVLAEFRNPCTIVTKSHLVTRDIGVLSAMAKWNGCAAFISMTTLDAELSSRMEPRAASPKRRLDAIAQLSAAGIPVGVMTAPVIPGLTDHELPELLKAAAAAGARFAGYIALRLPYGLKDLFVSWVERHYPLRAGKVVSRIRSMRGGELSCSEFGQRMRGEGIFAEQIGRMFKLARRRSGLDQRFAELSSDHFRRPTAQQTLWD